MNFLEPEKWSDLEKLEKEHEELTEDLIKQLHHKLRPYFLRRTKSEVLQLPPKVRLPFRYVQSDTYSFIDCARTKSSFPCP
jgi:SNF2 family DNA or RNA helicase